MANGYTTKEMFNVILEQNKEQNNKLDKLNARMNDFVEKNNTEHGKLWKAIMDIKASYSVAIVIIVAGIVIAIIKSFVK